MDNKNMNPPSGEDTSWLDDMLASSEYGNDAMQEVQDLSESVEDMELERIIREAKADDWDLTEAIMKETPVYDYPEESQKETYPDDFCEDDYQGEIPVDPDR